MPELLPIDDYRRIRDLLLERAGHDLGEGKEYLVESRLSILAELRGLAGPASLLERLKRFRERWLEDALVEAMMTGETSFFRNPSVYQRMRLDVLPALLASRSSSRRLRIWSAGCSTGQEAFSLAILILDHFPEARAWDVRIVATDISETALQQARDAIFNATEVRRGLNETQIQRHFIPLGTRWKLSDEVKGLVSFQKVNLIDSLPFESEFDVVFLRNVLIYFQADLKPGIFKAVRRSLRDDGYLFLGDSETILGVSRDFVFPPGDLDYYRPALNPEDVN